MVGFWWPFERRERQDSLSLLVDHERRITQNENAIKALVSSSAAGIADLRTVIAEHTAMDERRLIAIGTAVDVLVAGEAKRSKTEEDAKKQAESWRATWYHRAKVAGRLLVYAIVAWYCLWNMKRDPKFLREHWSAISWLLTHMPLI